MMTLTTVVQKKTATSVQIYWRVGVSRNGVIELTLPSACDEPDLIAELGAIHYLLFEKQIFNRYPDSGEGYQLTVSKGAIKKLALGKSNKQFAFTPSNFLRSRMKGVKILVSQNMEHMADNNTCQVEAVDLQEHLNNYKENEISSPSMGVVLVTQHAVEQYQERDLSGDPKRPRSSLEKRLKHPSLKQISIPQHVKEHKAKKYGTADNVEIWGHSSSDLQFLTLTQDNNSKVLVTVFERGEY